MNRWEKVTGSDVTKAMEAFEVRAEHLPSDYREAWEEIKARLWPRTDLTGRGLMPVFEDVLSFFEQMDLDGSSVQEALGGDVEGFCSALADEEGLTSPQNRYRASLDNRVARRLGIRSGRTR